MAIGTGGGAAGKKNPVVPPRRGIQRQELQEKLVSVSNVMQRLEEASRPDLFDELADRLYEAFIIAADVAPTRHATGCPRHPQGPVDPQAPEGWSSCLICNTHRRRTRSWAEAAAEQPKTVWTMPAPPYTFAGLNDRLYSINDSMMNFRLDSTAEELNRIADSLYQAFIVARELSRPKSVLKCPQHPYIDTPPDSETGGCTMCAVDARRKAAGLADPGIALRRAKKPPISLKRRFQYVAEEMPTQAQPHPTAGESPPA